MGCPINNASNHDMSSLEGIITNFYPYAKKRLGFNEDVGVNLVSDPENSKDPFGKTAYYDPNKMQITIFVDKRHVKDMLRSFSHELVHHAQNCRGDIDNNAVAAPGYAQKDPHMRRMEGEAYLLGNGFLVRDFEDQMKYGQLKENKQMSITKEQATNIARRIVEKMLPEGGEADCATLAQRIRDGIDTVNRYGQGHDDVVRDQKAYEAAGCPPLDGMGNPVKEEVVEEGELPPALKAYQDKKKGAESKDDSKDESEEKEKCPKCGKNPCECPKEEKGNVKEEIAHRNALLFERLKNKWAK
jgi:hypothetical protein